MYCDQCKAIVSKERHMAACEAAKAILTVLSHLSGCLHSAAVAAAASYAAKHVGEGHLAMRALL